MELTKEEKTAYLKTKGWCTWYNKDNWVHTEIMRGANLDWCGIDLESAYKCQLKIDNGSYYGNKKI